MIENLLEALQNLNYNDVQTLDLTKEEDNKKFKDAIEIIKRISGIFPGILFLFSFCF